MEFESKVVILNHKCPLCRHITYEVVSKIYNISKGTISYTPKFGHKKELYDKEPFIRKSVPEVGDILICPKCGVILYPALCETEYPYYC